MTEEIWKEIVGYEGYYEVSNLGGVRSLDRQINNRFYKGKILKPFPHKNGHLFVDLVTTDRFFVHTLVLEAFVCPRPDGLQCRHLDNNPTNNSVANLKWGTPKENGEDRALNGKMRVSKPKIQGEKHCRSKLTTEQVRHILISNEPHSELAKLYKVTSTTIVYIRQGKSWKHMHVLSREVN